MNAPDGPNVFSNLGCIRRLKLRQLRIPLDFEKDFLSGGRQNLKIRYRHGKRREIEAESVSIRGRIVPPTDLSKQRAYLDVDRCSVCLVTSFLLGLLLGVRHDKEVISGGGRV